MNRDSKVFVVDTEDGERWHFLRGFIAFYQDSVMDGEKIEDYAIREWTAGGILDCNSEWKDEDPDCYYNPLSLWNAIRSEIKWQHEHGITDMVVAQKIFDDNVAEYKPLRIQNHNDSIPLLDNFLATIITG